MHASKTEAFCRKFSIVRVNKVRKKNHLQYIKILYIIGRILLFVLLFSRKRTIPCSRI